MNIMNVRFKKASGNEEDLRMNGDEKITAAFYYYLSLDKLSSGEKRKHLEALFNIRQSLIWYLTTLGLKDPNETVPEDENYLDKYLAGKIKNPEGIENFSIAMMDFDYFKDKIIKHCEKVISCFEEDEQHERIVEEIDYLLKDSPNGILSYGKLKYLWIFIIYSTGANLLTDNRRRFLKHFIRITDIELSVYKELEEIAHILVAIGKRRIEAKASDKAYSKVVSALSVMDNEESDELKKLFAVLGMYSSESDGESEDCYDDDKPIYEKLRLKALGFLEKVADKLDDFADRL
jgi:hypothetical protein